MTEAPGVSSTGGFFVMASPHGPTLLTCIMSGPLHRCTPACVPGLSATTWCRPAPLMRLKIVPNGGFGTGTFVIIFVRMGTHLVVAQAVIVGHQGSMPKSLHKELPSDKWRGKAMRKELSRTV